MFIFHFYVTIVRFTQLHRVGNHRLPFFRRAKTYLTTNKPPCVQIYMYVHCTHKKKDGVEIKAKCKTL